MSENIRGPELIFFLGAGASVEAGVPDTYAMASEFEKEFEVNQYAQSHKKKVYHPFKRITKVLREWNKEKKIDSIDVEQLLETLEKLMKRDEEVLLHFADKRYFNLKPYADIEYMINSLKEFIKRKAIVTQQNIRYLSPILDFIEPNPFQPLVIFSVNYDSCVEQLCGTYKKTYTDGFNIYWNIEEFSKPDYEVKLFKIHGSVMWFETDRKEYVKIPIKTKESKITLITNESAGPLILYPMGKYQYIEPLTEMQIQLRRNLEKESTKYVIIVGYSFRDKYLIHMLWDAARKNRNLLILFVNPRARQVYESRLRYYDKDLNIPSSIEERVVLLPYEFGKVLPALKNVYIRGLREAVGNEFNLKELERQGQVPDWSECVRLYSECEFSSKVDSLMKNKVNWSGLSWETRSRCSFNMLMHCASIGDKRLEFWRDKLNKVLEESLSVDNIFIDLVSLGSNILATRLILRRGQGRNWEPRTVVATFTEKYNIKKNHLPRNAQRLILPFIDQLDHFLERCRQLEEKPVGTYIMEMKGEYPLEMSELSTCNEKADMKEMARIIAETEKKEFAEIFGGKSPRI